MPRIDNDLKFNNFVSQLVRGDVLAYDSHDITDISADLIDEGNKLDGTERGDFCAEHIFVYLGGGITIEADGTAVRYHHIDEYKKKIINGNRLAVFRLFNLSDNDFATCMQGEVKKELNTTYDKMALVGFGIYDLLKTNLLTGWLGDLFFKRGNPLAVKGELICDQSTRRIILSVPDKYNAIATMPPTDETEETPQTLADKMPAVAVMVLDTACWV